MIKKREQCNAVLYMNWLLYLKMFLSVFIAFLALGGGWVLMTIDQLRYYEEKEKIYRVLTGIFMFTSSIGLCVLYKEYIRNILS